MLLLTSTSDLVQVITTAAGQIDVHASWIDLASGTVTAGRTNTRVTTATTTTVVASPASSTSRNVKTLHVGNNHASVSNTVSLQHTDGTNVIMIEQVTLAPLERLSYIEGVGIRVFDSVGREKIPTAALSTGNANTADVTASAADTYLTGGNLTIANRIQAASFFKWRLRSSKTAAGTAAATVNLRVGTAGSTSDTARVTHTLAAATAATDTGMFEIDAIIRTAGATATILSTLTLYHSTAGFTTTGNIFLSGTSASFDITPASTILGLSVNPGAAGVWTFQEVTVEANNLIA